METRLDIHTDLLEARTAHVRRDWHTAYEHFARAGRDTALCVDDLDAMAVAAWRLGMAKESLRVAERVFAQLARTDPPSAAMKAVDLALAWVSRGDLNIGQGWMNRARRLLDGAPESPTHGYLAYLDALTTLMGRDDQALPQRVQTLRDLCGRLDSPAISALCHVVEALGAIRDARMAEAYGLIDEAMLPVLADQVPVDWAGAIYCVVLSQCHRLADLPRMLAWTRSMEDWCQDFAPSVNYHSVCDLYRLQLKGAAEDYRLLEERLSRASQSLEEVNSSAAAEGYYQLGELRRLGGNADGALAAFARARALGVDPQPGEALLRCRMGNGDAAWTDLRVALAGADRLGRMRLLRGAVEIALVRRCLDEAETYCAEMESSAEAFGTPGFRAWAAHAKGAILVRRERHAQALEALEAALREYRTQQSRYETAQVYGWMAIAHRGLGEDELSAADIATAENIYQQLGVESAEVCDQRSPGGLTKREIGVLGQVAGGATNKQVADRLFISEKTVGRHLANIYTKVGVASRTAAVTWAYAHNVLPPPE